MSDFVFIYSPFPDIEKARAAAKALLEERLIACANILPGMESHYHWQGKIDSASEVVLVAKTRAALFEQAKHAIERLHPYECPCIIALPIGQGNAAYLNWITQETKTP